MSRFSAFSRIRCRPIPRPVGLRMASKRTSAPQFADLSSPKNLSTSIGSRMGEPTKAPGLPASQVPGTAMTQISAVSVVPDRPSTTPEISTEDAEGRTGTDDSAADFTRAVNWFDLFTLAGLTAFGSHRLWKWYTAEHVTMVIGEGDNQEATCVHLPSVDNVNRCLRMHGESSSGQVGQVEMRSDTSGMACKAPVKAGRRTLLPGDVIQDEDDPRVLHSLGVATIISGHEDGYVAGLLQKLGHLAFLTRLLLLTAPGGVQEVEDAIRQGFSALNKGISLAVVDFVDNSRSHADDPAYTHDRDWTLGFLGSPNDGASMISTVLDGNDRMLYVAAVGRSNAVAAYEKDGRWRCDVLFQDQVAAKRDADTRIHTRLEGDKPVYSMRSPWGIYPERTVPPDAVGQAMKRWTDEEVQRLKAFAEEHDYAFNPRPDTRSEAFEVAQTPRIVHRPLTSTEGEKLRFVSSANEGIWEQLSPEEATLLTAARLDQSLNNSIPLKPVGKIFTLAGHIDADHGAQEGELVKSWEFEGDENAAVHLVRNAMGRGDERRTRALMSQDVTEGFRSAFMDELLVNVVFFNDVEEASGPQSEIWR